MTYKEYREQAQKEFNELPIFYAFGNDQFKEAMEKLGLTMDDTDKIAALGAGGYYLKKDAEVIRSFFKNDRLRELMKDPAFAEDAFYYEMWNHEYSINWEGDYDVCQCFGHAEYKEGAGGAYYLLEMGYTSDTVKAFTKAANRYYKECEEKEFI